MELQFADAAIHPGDIALLARRGWLNDDVSFFDSSIMVQILWFICEYFAHGPIVWATAKEQLAILNPCTVQLLSMVSDLQELDCILSALNLEAREWMFLPINDNEDEEAGGSHWTLLAAHIPSSRFLFYDSAASSSSAVEKARRLMQHLRAYLLFKGVVLATQVGAVCHHVAERQTSLVCGDSPRQCNGHDCGLHVVVTIRRLLEQPLVPPRNTLTSAGRARRLAED